LAFNSAANDGSAKKASSTGNVIDKLFNLALSGSAVDFFVVFLLVVILSFALAFKFVFRFEFVLVLILASGKIGVQAKAINAMARDNSAMVDLKFIFIASVLFKYLPLGPSSFRWAQAMRHSHHFTTSKGFKHPIQIDYYEGRRLAIIF